MDKQQREYIHHLMLQYSDAMVRLTYRRVGDWHLAEDLVQETFLTACCKSERVCGHKKPVAWLFETLNNLTLRESRRFYHTEVSIEDIATHGTSNGLSYSDGAKRIGAGDHPASHR